MEKYTMVKQAIVKLNECLQIYESTRNKEAGLVNKRVDEVLHNAYGLMLDQLHKLSVLSKLK